MTNTRVIVLFAMVVTVFIYTIRTRERSRTSAPRLRTHLDKRFHLPIDRPLCRPTERETNPGSTSNSCYACPRVVVRHSSVHAELIVKHTMPLNTKPETSSFSALLPTTLELARCQIDESDAIRFETTLLERTGKPDVGAYVHLRMAIYTENAWGDECLKE